MAHRGRPIFQAIHALEQRPRERVELRRSRARTVFHGRRFHGLRDRERLRARRERHVEGDELACLRDLRRLRGRIRAAAVTARAQPKNRRKREAR